MPWFFLRVPPSPVVCRHKISASRGRKSPSHRIWLGLICPFSLTLCRKLTLIAKIILTFAAAERSILSITLHYGADLCKKIVFLHTNILNTLTFFRVTPSPVVFRHKISAMHFFPAGNHQKLDDLSETDGNGEHVLNVTPSNPSNLGIHKWNLSRA